MPAFRPSPQRVLADRSGSVSLVFAGALVLITGIAAFGVDMGKMVLDRRKAQSAADLAAIAAAADLPAAERAAAATIARNGIVATAPATVLRGRYVADAALAPAQRFTPAAATAANAARVTLRTETPLYFARVFTGQPTFPITTTATAATTAIGSFAIGSRLASIEGGILNQLLSGLIGAEIGLSVMDYDALLSAQVDLFRFLPALATQLRMTGVSYDRLLSQSATLPDTALAAAAALKTAQGGSTTASAAMTRVAQAAAGRTAAMPLAALANLGPYGGFAAGDRPNGATLSVSAFDLLNTMATLAGGNRQVDLALSLNLPGIASATLALGIGERPVGASWIGVGGEGASAHTAQTRLLLKLRLLGAGAMPGVELPIYVEVAQATARLAALRCNRTAPASSYLSVEARPGIVDAWIANVSQAEFANMRSEPNPGPARLVDLSLLRVTGRGHATMRNMQAQTVTFSTAEVASRTVKTVGTRDYLRPLLAGLLRDTTLAVESNGLGITLPGGPTAALATILDGALPSIDRALAAILDVLGVGVGEADIWALGLRCDGAVLVQ